MVHKQPDSILNQITIASPCLQSWSAMTPCASGRHCSSCKKDVFDFSKHTAVEIEKNLALPNTHPCGRIHRKSNGSIIVRPAWSIVRATPLRFDMALTSVVTALLVLQVGFQTRCFGNTGLVSNPWLDNHFMDLLEGTFGAVGMLLSGVAAIWLLLLAITRGGRKIYSLAFLALGTAVTIYILRSSISTIYGEISYSKTATPDRWSTLPPPIPLPFLARSE